MKLLVKISGLLITLMLSQACMKNDTIQQPFSRLTVVNGYTASPRLTYTLDGNAFYTGNYTSANTYDIHVGNRRFAVLDENRQSLLDTTFHIRPLQYYSALSYGTAAEPKLILTLDSLLPNINNNVAIRFIHLANEVGAVSLYQGDQAIQGLGNREQETSLSVPESQKFISAGAPGVKTFNVRDAEGNVLATSRDITFVRGVHRTLILWGTAGSEAEPLRLVSY